MTRIEFYVNVPDKFRKVAELGEHIAARGRRLMVYVPDAAISLELGDLLWTQPQTGFLPHCRADDPLAEVTPVVIDWRSDKLVHDDVLINLRQEHPAFFSRFQRLIELVGVDEADKVQARQRYRFYRDRGYEIKSIDVLEAENP
jgi:DNA polymerase-3 subunit chi